MYTLSTYVHMYIATAVHTSFEDTLIITTDIKVEPLLLRIKETCARTIKQDHVM